MRKALLFLFLIPFSLHAFAVPEKPNTYVNDYAGILSVEEEAALETKVGDFERATTKEIAIVTIPNLEGDTIEGVAQEIFTAWGIGKAGENNGVLLLVALEERETRIHTGYGVEGDLTDIGTFYIQEEVMVPAFREGNYFAGIDGATDKMIEALGGNEIVPENYSQNESSGMNFEFIFFFVFIVLQFLIAILAKSKSWWGGGVLGGAVGGGLIWYFGIVSLISGAFALIIPVLVGLFFDYVVSKGYQKGKSTGSYPWWIGGGPGKGGGFGGGGFGGFGGGMSGGGGSSSRW